MKSYNNKQPMMISLVTVVFNEVNNIEKTIESIAAYKSKGIEYIIVDGGSTDGTIECIRKYKDVVDILISEPDKGIYDAMNKAILLCSGLYLLNINCGDVLLQNPIDQIPKDVFHQQKYDIILFNVLQSNNKIFYNRISPAIKLHNIIHHQGALYKKDVNLLYDLQYRVYADFDLNQRLYNRGAVAYKVEECICKHDLGGVSNRNGAFYENYRIVLKNYGIVYVVVAYFYHKIEGLKLRWNKLWK